MQADRIGAYQIFDIWIRMVFPHQKIFRNWNGMEMK